MRLDYRNMYGIGVRQDYFGLVAGGNPLNTIARNIDIGGFFMIFLICAFSPLGANSWDGIPIGYRILFRFLYAYRCTDKSFGKCSAIGLGVLS